jgi:hypothetical protein
VARGDAIVALIVVAAVRGASGAQRDASSVSERTSEATRVSEEGRREDFM